MARCECSGCGEKFGGVSGFDMHQRIGDAGLVCLPPASVGLRLENGVWRRPAPEDSAFHAGREPQTAGTAAPSP